jgi:hypothetical protein
VGVRAALLFAAAMVAGGVFAIARLPLSPEVVEEEETVALGEGDVA